MFTDDAQALTAYMVSEWSSVSAAPVFHDNQPNVARPASTFVRFSVVPGGSKHFAGSSQDGEVMQLGRVWLRVFVPLQSGMGEARDIVDKFAKLFRNQRLDNTVIHLRTQDYGTTEVRDGMLMVPVSIPYESYRRYG